MQAYAVMTFMKETEREAYKQALLEYCKLDTLAMAKILKKLYEAVR